MSEIHAVLQKYKSKIFGIPGVSGIAIGYKETNGQIQDQLAIIVFVLKKSSHVEDKYRIPEQLDGFVTDILEKKFGLELTSTDPFERFDDVFSGISITPEDVPPPWGTLGCIIRSNGNAHVPPGDYILTNQHVLWYADPNNPNSTSRGVIQPGRANDPPPPNYFCGNYIYGVKDPVSDCAICTIAGTRGWHNEVPNHPWRPGRRDLMGIAQAAVGDEVYKYGATTGNTRGVVRFIHYHDPILPIQNSIYIENPDASMWVAKGDSGSVLIRYADDFVVGLNFAADANTMLNPNQHRTLPDNLPAYYGGYAYDIQSQMNYFGAIVDLA
ncbi:MAG: hypothetical protein IPN79_15040 [Saprospiraceae bacterium]|nr:hypothetical protein [Saprospiraceae bacterium]